jgi:hypothetical protein
MQWKNCVGSGSPGFEARRQAQLRQGDGSDAPPTAVGHGLRLAILLGAVLFPGALAGCGDECSAATDKLSSCGAAAGDGGSNVSTETCDSWFQCQSVCVNNATCTQIKYQGPDSQYTQCLQRCGGR